MCVWGGGGATRLMYTLGKQDISPGTNINIDYVNM